MKPDRQRLKTLGILLILGILYYVETQTIGITLGCPFHKITGLNCPACGLTRACVALFHLDFAAAAAANWGLALSLPVLLPWLAILIFRWLWCRPIGTKGMKLTGVILAGWFLLWGIVRNLAGL